MMNITITLTGFDVFSIISILLIAIIGIVAMKGYDKQ